MFCNFIVSSEYYPKDNLVSRVSVSRPGAREEGWKQRDPGSQVDQIITYCLVELYCNE